MPIRRDGRQPLTGHQGAVNGLPFRNDGHFMLAGGDDGTIRLWDADIGSSTAWSGTTETTAATSVTTSADRHRIVSGRRDGSLRLSDADNRQLTGGRPTVSLVGVSANWPVAEFMTLCLMFGLSW
jgi:WD40 repeat protein